MGSEFNTAKGPIPLNINGSGSKCARACFKEAAAYQF